MTAAVDVSVHLNGDPLKVAHGHHDLRGEEWWTVVIETSSYPTAQVILFGVTPEDARALRDGAQALLEAMGEAMGAETPDAP